MPSAGNTTAQPQHKAGKYDDIARKYGDPWIWGIYFTLVIISIVESYSASSREIAANHSVYLPLIKQCIYLLLGGGLVAALYRIDYYKVWFLYLMIPALAIFTVFSLVYVKFFGSTINGAQRVIFLPGGFTLQPAEIAKLSIVTLLSYLLAKNQKDRDISTKGLVSSAFCVALYGGLLINSGLTNTLLLMTISLSMMLIGGTKLRKLFYIIIAYAVIMGVFYVIQSNNDRKAETFNQVQQTQQQAAATADSLGVEALPTSEKANSTGGLQRKGVWKDRLLNWWNSDSLVYKPIDENNTQEMYARMAQAHGGVFGVGIGNSRECSRLPLAFSDYIYSIIVEETGMVGGVIVLLLYLWLLARAAMIVRRSRRVLPSLLIIGMASMIVFQALFHMAINVGVFPVSGQQLPLISKGGTSILVTSVAFGIMLSVSRTIANYNNVNNKDDNTELPDGLDAENPTQIPPKNVWK